MSARISEIHSVLDALDSNWNWEFAYAPVPGQSRIKVTARSKTELTRTKVIVLNKEMIDQFPPAHIAQNLINLLPVLPEERPLVKRSYHMKVPDVNLNQHYEMLRDLYKTD